MAPTGALRDRARRRAKLAAAALLLGLAVQGGARAAEPYPSHPLRMIIPFPPGGSNDVVGRLVAQQLAQRLGQPVVVDNRAGAGGVIGIEAAAKADPDGYTLAFISSAFSANSSLYRLSYDPVKSFTPVAMIAAGPNVLTVCNSLPVNTVAELLALAHANPGQLNYASAGIGSFQHLVGALFVSMTKVDIVHVPFKGGGPAMVDVIAGNTQIMLGSLVQILPMVKAGKLKALGVGGPKRSPTLPQVPTISEAGVTGYEAINWWGLVAPAGTPPAVIERVHSEIGAIQRAPDMQRRFEAEAVEALQMSPAQFGKYMQDETAKWARVVRDANIQAQ